jgi:hypothetical protein
MVLRPLVVAALLLPAAAGQRAGIGAGINDGFATVYY